MGGVPITPLDRDSTQVWLSFFGFALCFFGFGFGFLGGVEGVDSYCLLRIFKILGFGRLMGAGIVASVFSLGRQVVT